MTRYKAVKGSQTAHCCFQWTVVDTTQPLMIGGEHYKDEYIPVCECWEREDADRIVQALNTDSISARLPDTSNCGESIVKSDSA